MLSIRNEYLSELAKYRELLGISDRAYISLSILRRAAAIEAATLPMERTGYKFAPGFVEDLIDDLHAKPLATLIRKTAPTVVKASNLPNSRSYAHIYFKQCRPELR